MDILLTVKLPDPQSPNDFRTVELQVNAAHAVRNRVEITLKNAGTGSDPEKMRVVGAQQNADGTITLSLQRPDGGAEVVKTNLEGKLMGFKLTGYDPPASTP